MSPTFLRTLKPGTPYRVTLKGHRSTLRIFKYLERRWKSIPSVVFTSRVQAALMIEVLGKGQLRLSGPHMPRTGDGRMNGTRNGTVAWDACARH